MSMPVIKSFSVLVEAITRSLAEAQDQFERHQIGNLLNYFDKDMRPRGLEFRVPSMRADAKPGEEDFYSASFLSLVPINALKIKDVEVKFTVDLGEISESEAKGLGSEQAHAAMKDMLSPMKSMGISTPTHRGGMVSVVLRVEGTEPSEGAARLHNALAQAHMVYPSLSESSDAKPTQPPAPGTAGATKIPGTAS